jgi:hypothetical protein
MKKSRKRRMRRKRSKEKRFYIRYTFYIDQNNIIYSQPFFTQGDRKIAKVPVLLKAIQVII